MPHGIPFSLHRRRIGLLAAFLLALSGGTVRGEDALQKGVSEAARNIVAVMKAVRAESVTILDFEDKTTFGATVLTGLKQMLTDELTRLRVNLKPHGGAVGVKGILKVAKSETAGKVLHVDFALTDSNGDDLKNLALQLPGPDGVAGKQPVAVAAGKLPQDFNDDTALLTAFGGNVDLHSQPPIQKDWNNAEALQNSIDRPTALIADQVSAKASQESPFAVQVISKGTPKKLRLVDGQPFVDLEAGEKFSVRIINRAPFKANTTITLDGINMYHFSKLRKPDGSPKYSSSIVPIGTADVNGWHLDNKTAQEFVATSYQQSKLKELGLAATPIGAITVEFRTAWDMRTQAPEDENNIRQKVAAADGSVSYKLGKQYAAVFIGGGDEIEQRVQEVQQQIGRIRGVVSIRYRHPTVE